MGSTIEMAINYLKIPLFFFFFFFFSVIHAASLQIKNDSSYELTATIYSARGEFLGELTIPPSNSTQWRDSYQNASDWTAGPYTVVFTCPNGEEFGRVRRVNDGFSVYARHSIGPKYCKRLPTY